MIGPLEIVILLVIILLITGAYKKLPQLGRSAGTNARIGTKKAREFADENAPKAKELADRVGTKGGEVGSKVGERFDAKTMGRKAGEGLREARDLRDSFKGTLDPPKKVQAERPAEVKPKPATAPEPAAAPEPDPDPRPLPSRSRRSPTAATARPPPSTSGWRSRQAGPFGSP